MRIYLSLQPQSDKSYLWINNLSVLDNSVDQNEAKEIIIDRFLSNFNILDIEKVLDKILSKLRMNSDLTIIEQDIDIILLKYFRNEISLHELNNMILNNRSIKSLLNIEQIETYINNKLHPLQKHIDSNNGTIILKYKRNK